MPPPGRRGRKVPASGLDQDLPFAAVGHSDSSERNARAAQALEEGFAGPGDVLEEGVLAPAEPFRHGEVGLDAAGEEAAVEGGAEGEAEEGVLRSVGPDPGSHLPGAEEGLLQHGLHVYLGRELAQGRFGARHEASERGAVSEGDAGELEVQVIHLGGSVSRELETNGGFDG